MSRSDLATLWPKVDVYLNKVLPVIEKSRWFGKEGTVQTAVTRLAHDGMTVFDREACPSFTDTAEKTNVMAKEAALLNAGLSGQEKWWAIPRLGEECDAVALDRHGRMLAVEVKPSTANAKSIVWAPLQAAYYARLFQRWIESDPGHAKAIDGLIQQRTRLGLTTTGPHTAGQPLDVVPMVIIGGGDPTKEVLRRCREVRSRILADGLVTELQLWSLADGVLTDLIRDV
jgi:hypothetical protein